MGEGVHDDHVVQLLTQRLRSIRARQIHHHEVEQSGSLVAQVGHRMGSLRKLAQLAKIKRLKILDLDAVDAADELLEQQLAHGVDA